MRRILLIVAMLLVATAPAMATVTVRAMQNSPTNAIGQYTTAGRVCNIIDVNYTCDAAESVRAFALEITLDSGFVISDINNFVRGESNSVTPGYGIFPGSFRNFLTPDEIDWQDLNYMPIAPTEDPDAAGTGLGTNKVILEMGSLYVGDVNKPGSAGTLCRLTVTPLYRGVDTNGFGASESNLNLAVNTLRGGVVLEDGSSVVPTLVARSASGVAGKVSFNKIFPCWEPYRLQFNEWLSVWEPRCWAGWQVGDVNFRVQCKGDADNKTEGALKYRVYTSDYNKLIAAWGKRATQLRAGMGTDGNLMCADFDHKYEGALKYRVYTSDYNILIANWSKRETQLKPYGPIP